MSMSSNSHEVQGFARGLDAGTGRGLEFFYCFLEQGNLICRIMLAKMRFFFLKENWDDIKRRRKSVNKSTKK